MRDTGTTSQYRALYYLFICQDKLTYTKAVSLMVCRGNGATCIQQKSSIFDYDHMHC